MTKNPKHTSKIKKKYEKPRFPRDPCGDPCGSLSDSLFYNQSCSYQPCKESLIPKMQEKLRPVKTYTFLMLCICLSLLVLWLRFFVENVFWIPRRKTMQHPYEITSKSQFWIRNVENWMKTLTSVMSGPAVDWVNYETYKGKYKEIM